MKYRRRFHETLAFGRPDRVPYFQEGIRPEVLEAWQNEGMDPAREPDWVFQADPRVELQPELDPRPALDRLPENRDDLDDLARRLDPRDPARFPQDWQGRVDRLRNEDTVRMLRIHRGLFLTFGVRDWKRFYEVVLMLAEDAGIARDAMRVQGEFCARLADVILRHVEVDAAVFSEPIGGNDGPLLSPRLYADIALRSYQPILDVLRRHGVHTLIFRTYANARLLIPAILEHGFNTLWACEVQAAAMDYADLRREFGRDLRLIGGIDLDALRRGRDAIDRELNRKLPPLLEQGGFIPLADGRVREDVPYPNYRYYRQRLRVLTEA